MPSLRSPQVRMGSPAPGCSTLMMSAPNSPSAVATIGPAASVAVSTTRRPSSGPDSRDSANGNGLRPGDPEVFAERRAHVPLAEHAAALQFGHDHADNVLV